MAYQPSGLAVCETCGTQYDVPLANHPKSCHICDDPRQYVPLSGQSWTSLLKENGLQKNKIEPDPLDPRIHYISTIPLTAAQLPPGLSSLDARRKQLGIGERAILLQTPHGNVLWDLIAYLDQDTIDFIQEKGGLKAIVVSHPHFYTTHLEWAGVFECPVYASKEDEGWVSREDREGRRRLVGDAVNEIVEGVNMIRAGGHFDGSAVLLWEGKLFVADTMMITPSGLVNAKHLPNTVTFSFMWAYPNMIPLPPSKVHGIWKALKPFEFDSAYGGFEGQYVSRPDLKAQVLESMKIFLRTAGHENAAVFEETV